jgi:hypothetical protein
MKNEKPEIKYTTDGKKVVVIGSLNSQEKIVQEVFIVSGQELPSGENFVVKTLHDAPAVSWKQKELESIEARYETRRREIDNLEQKLRNEACKLRNKLEYAGNVLKNVSPESFNTLVDYLTGQIKWIVKTSYTPELIEWKDFIISYENKLRLISLYGKDDGTLTYAIGSYYDFSGGDTHFTPFNNYEDALAKFKELLLEQTITENTLKIAKKYNIEFPEEKVKKYREDKVASLNANIKSYRDSIAKWESDLEENKFI